MAGCQQFTATRVKWTVEAGPVLSFLGEQGTVYIASMNSICMLSRHAMRRFRVGTVQWRFRFAEFPGNKPAAVSRSPYRRSRWHWHGCLPVETAQIGLVVPRAYR